MIVTKITTNDYDTIINLNSTHDYNITDNCTNDENNIDISIPTKLLTRPCLL